MKPLTLTAETKKQFDAIMKEHHPILILYHMDGCYYCDQFMPAWSKVKTNLARRRTIHVVDVERAHMGLLPTNLQNIQGYPHVQLVKNGHVVEEYKGNRTKDDVIAFAIKHVRPSSAPVKKTVHKPLKAKKVKSV